MNDYLARLLASRALTQADAARLAGVTRAAVNAWTAGNSAPSPEALGRLLDGVAASAEERAEARALMERHLRLDAITPDIA